MMKDNKIVKIVKKADLNFMKRENLECVMELILL